MRGRIIFVRGETLPTDAQLYLHKLLADVVVHAAELAFQRHGLTLVLYDGLRTVEAQQKMLETRRVKENPHWVENIPRLLSPPRRGGIREGWRSI